MSTLSLITHTVAATQRLAAHLARQLPGGSVLCLVGEVGAGKTTFAQGFLRSLGVRRVASPTFVVANKSKIHRTGGVRWVLHADLYRLPAGTSLHDIGLLESLGQNETITLIEWADRAVGLPKKCYRLEFQTINATTRLLHPSANLKRLLQEPSMFPSASRQRGPKRPRPRRPVSDR